MSNSTQGSQQWNLNYAQSPQRMRSRNKGSRERQYRAAGDGGHQKKILYIVENQRDVLHASTVHKASGRRSHLRTLCAVQQENVVFCLRRCVQGDPVDNYLSGTGLLNAINKLIAPASILSIFIRTVVPLSVAQAQQLLRLINNESLVPHYR